jgi:hypothetical protein
LAKNPRLLKEIEADMKAAEAEYIQTGEPVRIFKNFRYRTLEDTWSCSSRVVAKAEHLKKGGNPRFVVWLANSKFCLNSPATGNIRNENASLGLVKVT